LKIKMYGALATWSSGTVSAATEETGAMGREQGDQMVCEKIAQNVAQDIFFKVSA
jgi:hypothetical protein